MENIFMESNLAEYVNLSIKIRKLYKRYITEKNSVKKAKIYRRMFKCICRLTELNGNVKVKDEFLFKGIIKKENKRYGTFEF